MRCEGGGWASLDLGAVERAECECYESDRDCVGGNWRFVEDN